MCALCVCVAVGVSEGRFHLVGGWLLVGMGWDASVEDGHEHVVLDAWESGGASAGCFIVEGHSFMRLRVAC